MQNISADNQPVERKSFRQKNFRAFSFVPLQPKTKQKRIFAMQRDSPPDMLYTNSQQAGNNPLRACGKRACGMSGES
jgi:hypothetical protein